MCYVTDISVWTDLGNGRLIYEITFLLLDSTITNTG